MIVPNVEILWFFRIIGFLLILRAVVGIVLAILNRGK